MSRMSAIFCCLFLLQLCLVSAEKTNDRRVNSFMDFLQRIRHFEKESNYSHYHWTNPKSTAAIRTLPNYANLPEKRKLDTETLSVQSRPKCGVPDAMPSKRNKRYSIAPTRGWKKRHITYYIANQSRTISRDAVRRCIRKAFDKWSAYSGLTFEEVNSKEADSIFSFETGDHGDGNNFRQGVLAHAFYPHSHGHLSGDVHMNDVENWIDTENIEDDGIQFYPVILHEIGHSLGLLHSADEESVMFMYFDGQFKELGRDDILGLRELYGDILRDKDYQATTSTSTVATPTTTRKPIFPWKTQNIFTMTQTRPTPMPKKNIHTYSRTTSRRPVTFTTTPRTTKTISTRTRKPTFNNKEYLNFIGDSETISEHMKHDHWMRNTEMGKPSLPDLCSGIFDAIGTFYNEIYVFIDKYIWKMGHPGEVVSGYPKLVEEVFKDLPKNISKIDAAYERNDGRLILITGRSLWAFNGHHFEDSPITFSSIGLPPWLSNIDAAYSLKERGKTYFYWGDQYWRYDENRRKIDPGYPKIMKETDRMPKHPNAAVTWQGLIYIFKNGEVVTSSYDTMTRTTGPYSTIYDWTRCKLP